LVISRGDLTLSIGTDRSYQQRVELLWSSQQKVDFGGRARGDALHVISVIKGLNLSNPQIIHQVLAWEYKFDLPF